MIAKNIVAIQHFLKSIHNDLSNLLALEPLNTNDEDPENYYSPQDSVDSFEEGGYEFYSPQDTNRPKLNK